MYPGDDEPVPLCLSRAIGSEQVSLNAAGVSWLLQAILVYVVKLLSIEDSAELSREVDRLAKGELPPSILSLVRAIVGDAIEAVPGIEDMVREHARYLLSGELQFPAHQTIAGPFIEDPDGYLVMIKSANGTSRVLLPFGTSLLAEITESLLSIAVEVATLPSLEEARQQIVAVSIGRFAPKGLGEAIAVAVLASLARCTALPDGHKNTFLRLESVTRLLA